MAFNKQISDLIDRLTTQSREGKVEWEETADDGVFQTTVSRFIVTIAKVETTDWGEPNFIRIRILDREGRIVDTAEEPEPNSLLTEGAQNWKNVEALHELARRRARHVDEALADLLSALE